MAYATFALAFSPAHGVWAFQQLNIFLLTTPWDDYHCFTIDYLLSNEFRESLKKIHTTIFENIIYKG